MKVKKASNYSGFVDIATEVTMKKKQVLDMKQFQRHTRVTAYLGKHQKCKGKEL